MKLIDKHLLHTLLVPLSYCLAAFLLVYVIYDLFDNLSDFVHAGTPLIEVTRYYLLLLPSVLIYIVPVSLLLAVLYSLSQLTKNNELTAMRASGVSLYRLMFPYIMIGLFSTLAVTAVHETVGPWSAYWANQFVRAQRHKGKRISVYVAENLAFKNEAKRRIWLISLFDIRTYDMTNVELVQQREDGSDVYKLQAKSGQWLDNRWWLSGVTIQEYDENGHPVGAPIFERRKELTEANEKPADFLNEIKDPQYLSSRELVRFLKTHRHLSEDTLARVRVDLHSRLAMPWTCLIVTLLGIPFGAQTGRKGAFLGVTLSLGLFFTFYILINVGLALGKKQAMSPWLAAWLPNMIFVAIGGHMVHRMR